MKTNFKKNNEWQVYQKRTLIVIQQNIVSTKRNNIKDCYNRDLVLLIVFLNSGEKRCLKRCGTSK